MIIIMKNNTTNNIDDYICNTFQFLELLSTIVIDSKQHLIDNFNDIMLFNSNVLFLLSLF